MKTIKISLFFLFLFGMTNIAFSQNSEPKLTNISVLNLIPLAYSYEFPVAESSTIRLRGGLSLSGEFQYSSSQGSTDGYALTPFFDGMYRWYYHTKSETNKKKKPLFFNSGNFIYGVLKANTEAIAEKNYNIEANAAVAGGWGIQRIYKNRFVFSLALGLGVDMNDPGLFFDGDIVLGILLSPKIKK